MMHYISAFEFRDISQILSIFLHILGVSINWCSVVAIK